MFDISPQIFYSSLIDEVMQNQSGLDDHSHQLLKEYYLHLANTNHKTRKFYRFNWINRITPMINILASLPIRTIPWRILDASCGCGSEALLWSMLRSDFEVEGIDIAASRLKLACSRCGYYEQLSGRPLHLHFNEIIVFKHLELKNYDVVWVMESLSHITPAEMFITKVYETLNENGALVISDSNPLNPIMAYRILEKRKAESKSFDRVTLTDGTLIPYSNERLYSIGYLIRLLKITGFRYIQSQYCIFFPPTVARFSWLFRLCMSLDVNLNKFPLLRNIGGIYTVVCRK